MVEDQEEKEFQQFDWWRTKVCPLGLHTRHHCPNESTLQNAYMAILLESFGTKNFTSQTMVKRKNYGTKNFSSWQKIKFGELGTTSHLVGSHVKLK
jgi:hypothetical protein